MAVWFTILAVAGAASVAQHPGILRAISPTYGVSFLVEHGGVAFAALGSVVLTVTGAEALYADMGHFGRTPIRRAWFVVVFPALILNYMGQGALILRDPQADRQPVLPAVPALGAAADGRARDVRDRDRLAGGDLGRVLGHAPGGAARLPAAPDDPAHVARRGRAGLRPGRQLGDLRRGRRARDRLRLGRAPRLGLRHRGDRDAGDRHRPLLRRRARAVAQAAVARDRWARPRS